jgi:hypothetical protein
MGKKTKKVKYIGWISFAFALTAIGFFIGVGNENMTAQTEKSAEGYKAKEGLEANLEELRVLTKDAKQPVDWQKIYFAAVALKELKDSKTEEMFLFLLKRKEPVALMEDSAIPAAMSPLNMLKAIAMESLFRTGGDKYLNDFASLYKETDERVLKEMAKRYITKLKGKIPE